VWGLVVPALGVTQDQLLLGPAHWIIQVLHLRVGLAALALANVLGVRALARLGAPQPKPIAQPARGG
jgi:hypothetical protein